MCSEVEGLKRIIESLQQQKMMRQSKGVVAVASLVGKKNTTPTPNRKRPSRRKVVDEDEEEDFSEEDDEDAGGWGNWDDEDKEWEAEVAQPEGRSTRSAAARAKTKKGVPKPSKPQAKTKAAPQKSKQKRPPKKPRGKRSTNELFADEEIIFSPTSSHFSSVTTAFAPSALTTSPKPRISNPDLTPTQQQIQEVKELCSQQEHLIDSLRESPFKSYFEETDQAPTIETKTEPQDFQFSLQQQQQQQLIILQRQQQQRQQQQQLQHHLQQQLQQMHLPSPHFLTPPPPCLKDTRPDQPSSLTHMPPDPVMQMHQNTSNLQAQLVKAQLQAQLDPSLQHGAPPQWPTNGMPSWPPSTQMPWSTIKWAQTQARQAQVQAQAIAQAQVAQAQAQAQAQAPGQMQSHAQTQALAMAMAVAAQTAEHQPQTELPAQLECTPRFLV
jgi:hypothetical protein